MSFRYYFVFPVMFTVVSQLSDKPKLLGPVTQTSVDWGWLTTGHFLVLCLLLPATLKAIFSIAYPFPNGSLFHRGFRHCRKQHTYDTAWLVHLDMEEPLLGRSDAGFELSGFWIFDFSVLKEKQPEGLAAKVHQELHQQTPNYWWKGHGRPSAHPVPQGTEGHRKSRLTSKLPEKSPSPGI